MALIKSVPTIGNQQERLCVGVSEARLGWLGGVWDGEGSVILSFQKQFTTGKFRLEPSLTVVNTDLVFIEEVVRIFDDMGWAYYFREDEQKNPNWKKKYQVRSTGLKRVSKIIPTLNQYMVSKKERGLYLQEYCESRLAQSVHDAYTDRQIELYRLVSTKDITESSETIRSLLRSPRVYPKK